MDFALSIYFECKIELNLMIILAVIYEIKFSAFGGERETSHCPAGEGKPVKWDYL